MNDIRLIVQSLGRYQLLSPDIRANLEVAWDAVEEDRLGDAWDLVSGIPFESFVLTDRGIRNDDLVAYLFCGMEPEPWSFTFPQCVRSCRADGFTIARHYRGDRIWLGSGTLDLAVHATIGDTVRVSARGVMSFGNLSAAEAYVQHGHEPKRDS